MLFLLFAKKMFLIQHQTSKLKVRTRKHHWLTINWFYKLEYFSDFDCKFFEISAAEQVTAVSEAFLELCREVLQAKRKSKQSFIDKIDRMLGGTRVYNRGKSDSALPKD